MFRTKTIAALAAICILTASTGISSANAGFPRRVIRAVVAPRIVAPYYGSSYRSYRPTYGAYRSAPTVNFGIGYPRYGYGYPGYNGYRYGGFGYGGYGYGYPSSGVRIQIGGFN